MTQHTFYLRQDGAFWRVIYGDNDYVFPSFETAVEAAREGAALCQHEQIPVAIKRMDGDKMQDVLLVPAKPAPRPSAALH